MNIQKALKDEELAKIMMHYGAEKSILFLHKNQIYTKSTAIITMIKSLGGGFKLVGISFIFPKGFRDWIYDFIARNRYRFFGKRTSCHLPSSEFTDRFL